MSLYFGKVCAKHPELQGERYASRGCIACSAAKGRRQQQSGKYAAQKRAYDVKRRQDPERRALERTREREIDRQRRQDPEYRARKNASVRKVKALSSRYNSAEYRAQESARLRRWKQRPEYLAQYRERYSKDSTFALLQNVRCRVRHVLQGKQKAASTLALLGVESVEQYKTYLEQQFLPGFTWENYGKVWHVDHRIPLSLLSLSTPEDQRFAFNYKNTRPMLAAKNIARGNKLVFEDLL